MLRKIEVHRFPHMIPIVMLVALLAGIIIGWGGILLAAILLSFSSLLLLGFSPPFITLLIWFVLSSFLQGRVINLGPGIPDLSLDRILISALVGFTLIYILKKGSKLSIGIEGYLILVFLGWGFISILFWRPTQPSLQILALVNQFIFPILIYWVVQHVVTSESQLKLLMTFAVITLILLALPAPIEEITGKNMYGTISEVVAGVVRIQSFTRAAWEFGAIGGMLLSFSLYPLTYQSESWKKRLSITGVILGCIALFLTFMRGTWLAIGAMIFLVFITKPKLRRWIITFIFFAIILALIFGPQITNTEVWHNRVMETGNVVGRQLIFTQQVELFLKSPIFGQGLMPTFTLYDLGTVYAGATAYYSRIISHNTYMSTLLDFGLFGLVYYLAIFIILIKGIKVYIHFPTNILGGKELLIVLFGALLVFFVQSATFETRIFPLINSFVWFTLGLVQVASRIDLYEPSI